MIAGPAMKKYTLAVMTVAMVATFGGSASAANPEAGKKFAGEVCVACHGVDGNSPNPDFPKIGGQHPDYLAKALHDYQSGARSNPIMKGFAGMLKSEDIDNVAAWYAIQPQVLTTHR
jgi:cytochrome c553